MLREHAHRISAAGVAGLKTFVQVLLGMIVGGMTAVHRFSNVEGFSPFASALYARAQALAEAFDKIVWPQVKISALNTLLTALYLVVILPLAGVRFPLVTVSHPVHFCHEPAPCAGKRRFEHPHSVDQPGNIFKGGAGFVPVPGGHTQIGGTW